MNHPRLGPPVLIAAAALFLHAGTPDPAAAQFRVGLQAGYGSSSGIEPGFGLGVRGMFGLGLADPEGGGDTALGALSALVTVDRFFPDCDRLDCGLWELNGNLVLPLFAARGFTPYVGAGAGLARLSVDEDEDVDPVLVTDTDIGVNLLGGLRYRTDGFTTFGELRQNIGGGEDPFYVSFGLLFGG